MKYMVPVCYPFFGTGQMTPWIGLVDEEGRAIWTSRFTAPSAPLPLPKYLPQDVQRITPCDNLSY